MAGWALFPSCGHQSWIKTNWIQNRPEEVWPLSGHLTQDTRLLLWLQYMWRFYNPNRLRGLRVEALEKSTKLPAMFRCQSVWTKNVRNNSKSCVLKRTIHKSIIYYQSSGLLNGVVGVRIEFSICRICRIDNGWL